MTFAVFMSEFFKILLDKIREQSFLVILLLGSLWGLYTMHQKTEDKLENKITVVESDLKVCNEERGKLSVEVAKLTERFNLFMDGESKPKKKK
jgi:hypothetical protein